MKCCFAMLSLSFFFTLYKYIRIYNHISSCQANGAAAGELEKQSGASESGASEAEDDDRATASLSIDDELEALLESGSSSAGSGGAAPADPVAAAAVSEPATWHVAKFTELPPMFEQLTDSQCEALLDEQDREDELKYGHQRLVRSIIPQPPTPPPTPPPAAEDVDDVKHAEDEAAPEDGLDLLGVTSSVDMDEPIFQRGSEKPIDQTNIETIDIGSDDDIADEEAHNNKCNYELMLQAVVAKLEAKKLNHALSNRCALVCHRLAHDHRDLYYFIGSYCNVCIWALDGPGVAI